MAELDLRPSTLNVTALRGLAMIITNTTSEDWSGYSFSYVVEDMDGNTMFTKTSTAGDIAESAGVITLTVTDSSMDLMPGDYRHTFKYWSVAGTTLGLWSGTLTIEEGA